MTSPIQITLFRWAGQWGPFKVNIPCGECALTLDVIKDVMETELAGIPVELEVLDWLSHWWKPLPKGGWHAPITLVEGKVVSQGAALNRGVLTEAVVKAWTQRSKREGTVVFGKKTCPHCVRAKGYLDEAGVVYEYSDVVKEPRALYEMVARVKEIIGDKTPVTVPQIWIDGEYIGGADALGDLLNRQDIIPNPERGRNSLSPSQMAAAE
ncbi:MAG: glutaredoxin domain-containing protein [Maricaulaceae bacterium]